MPPEPVLPAFAGPAVPVSELTVRHGPVEGVVLGYGAGELAEDGRFDWPAAVLPPGRMRGRIEARQAEGRRGPFLIAMGSLRGVEAQGGAPNALIGVALASDVVMGAPMLLHERHLRSPHNLKNGLFRWPEGIPLLRIWLCDPPQPYVDFTGFDPSFRVWQAADMLPPDRVVPGLSEGILRVMVREVEIDRAQPLPKAVAGLLTWQEGHRKWREIGERVRDREAVRAALTANAARHGRLQCETCPYTPAEDPGVPKGYGRQMMDVHHRHAISHSVRTTALEDLMVLCPTCHRRAHVQGHAVK